MEPPKLCPDCKTYHHTHQAHVWNKAPTENVAPVVKKVVRPKVKKSARPKDGSDEGEKKPFDRKAYQRKYMRDYMRKRRKEERGE
ncbi:MAG TPA: hypothetical protein ENG78_02390 [Acidiferrobacteraceae bacterium]|nr:hypothetical protein [Acidiferrobacteraceae bacterium]HEX19657.1 hypothetical protein [Acidiferrobacteraceae bacterium]